MNDTSWCERGFDDLNVTYSCVVKKEETDHNNCMILKVRNPIVQIESKNSGSAKSMSDDVMKNLAISLHLCIGLKVVLERNYLNISLSSRSTRIGKEITCKPGSSASALPKFTLVDFSASCIDYSFFPNDESKYSWFPIFSIKNVSYAVNKNRTNGFTDHSWIMLPLKLC